MSQLEELCTIKQACFSEKAGRTTIYKRIKEGHYTAYKIGGSTRLTMASIKLFRKTLNPSKAPEVFLQTKEETHA